MARSFQSRGVEKPTFMPHRLGQAGHYCPSSAQPSQSAAPAAGADSLKGTNGLKLARS